MKFKIWFENEDYRGYHKAPSKNFGAPLHDLTAIYPDDVYGPNGIRYYGYGNPKLDNFSFMLIKAARNKPNMQVEIYRAVPDNLSSKEEVINVGDWVTINKRYAIMHGEGPLDGKYKILTKTVPAKSIYTNGDSILEWGYYP